MGKKKGSAGQRAKKKQAKEQKRKKVLARRGPGAGHPPHGNFTPRPKDVMWKPSHDGITGLARLRRSTFIEAVFAAEHLGCVECGSEELPEQLWTRVKVNQLSTPEILTRLAGHGVSVDQEGFVEGTRGRRSAVEYAREAWLPLVPASADVHARDFVCLAANELWVRWRPETPSQEMLLEPLFLGEYSGDHGGDAAAIKDWLRFWTTLAPLIPSEMRTLVAVDAWLGRRPGALFGWVTSFMLASAYEVRENRALGLQGLAACEEIRDRFPEGTRGSWISLAEGAQIIHEGGEREEAERILRKEIEGYPRRSWAYVTLADCWSEHEDADHEQVARALALIEQAAALPTDDCEDWYLSDQIEDLRAQLTSMRRSG